MYPYSLQFGSKLGRVQPPPATRRSARYAYRCRREAARDRAHQGSQGRPGRAGRHLPLRRARVRRDRARRPGAVSLVRRLHPARRGVGGVGRARARPRRPTACSCCGSSSRTASSPPSSCARSAGSRSATAAGWATSPPARTSSCTGCAIEDMPVVLDELNAVGLSFTQACGDVWRNVVGCPLAGVDGHELIDSRPLIARARAHVRRRSRASRTCRASSRCRCRAACTAAPSTRSTTSALVAVEQRRRDRLRRLGRRRPGRVGADGPAAGRVRAARGGGRGVRGDHRDLPRRGQAHQAHTGADQVPGGRVGGGAAARRGRAQDRPQPAGPRSSPPSRSTRTATTWASTRSCRPGSTTSARPRCAAASRAEQMIARRRHRRPLRVGRAPLHQPPERDRARTCPTRSVDEAAASLADIGLPTEASTFRRGIISCTGMEFCKLAIVETKERAAELIEHLERRVGDVAGSLRINLNGCPNACAQYQMADIGLQGGIARLPDGSRVQGFILHIGGRLGEDAGFGRRVVVEGDPGRGREVRGRADRARLRGRASAADEYVLADRGPHASRADAPAGAGTRTVSRRVGASERAARRGCRLSSAFRVRHCRLCVDALESHRRAHEYFDRGPSYVASTSRGRSPAVRIQRGGGNRPCEASATISSGRAGKVPNPAGSSDPERCEPAAPSGDGPNTGDRT